MPEIAGDHVDIGCKLYQTNNQVKHVFACTRLTGFVKSSREVWLARVGESLACDVTSLVTGPSIKHDWLPQHPF